MSGCVQCVGKLRLTSSSWANNSGCQYFWPTPHFPIPWFLLLASLLWAPGLRPPFYNTSSCSISFWAVDFAFWTLYLPPSTDIHQLAAPQSLSLSTPWFYSFYASPHKGQKTEPDSKISSGLLIQHHVNLVLANTR